MSSSAENNMQGEWVHIDPNSKEAKDIAIWAVNEHNKEHPEEPKLRFDSAFDAKKCSKIGAVTYRIGMYASDLFIPVPHVNKYGTEVVEIIDPSFSKQLVYFKPLLQDERIMVAN
ncbi:unnamed protein product [Amaranthus hypochondriacus]